MPALPVAPQVLRFDFHFQIGEDLVAKTRQFWRYSGSAPSVTALNSYAGAVITQMATDMAPVMSTECHLLQIVITDLTSPTSSVGQDSTAFVGTDTHGVVPASACVLQELNVSRRYRGGHPRVYWPWGTQNDLQDAQTWSSTAVANFTDAAQDLQDAIVADVPAGSGSVGPVNVSYYSGFTTHTGTTGRVRNVSKVRDTTLIDPITGFGIANGVASQRKRLLHLA